MKYYFLNRYNITARVVLSQWVLASWDSHEVLFKSQISNVNFPAYSAIPLVLRCNPHRDNVSLANIYLNSNDCYSYMVFLSHTFKVVSNTLLIRGHGTAIHYSLRCIMSLFHRRWGSCQFLSPSSSACVIDLSIV